MGSIYNFEVVPLAGRYSSVIDTNLDDVDDLDQAQILSPRARRRTRLRDSFVSTIRVSDSPKSPMPTDGVNMQFMKNFMDHYYTYLSAEARANAYYIPQAYLFAPRNAREVELRYPSYFSSKGSDLENDLNLPEDPADLEELSLVMADHVVKRMKQNSENPPTLSPRSHLHHPYWVIQHSSSDIIANKGGVTQEQKTKLANLRSTGAFPIPSYPSIEQSAWTGVLIPYDQDAVKHRYWKFLTKSMHELADESLPQNMSELETLSMWVADGIMKCLRMDKSFQPPFSPKAHPCYPTWMPDHPSNLVILRYFQV